MRSLAVTTTTLVLALAAAGCGMVLARAPVPRAVPAVQAPAEAVAGLVWRSGTATLRLTDRPCPQEEFTQLLETEAIPPARGYVVEQGGRRFAGCWAKDIGGDVMTMEPERGPATIPLGWFSAGEAV